MSLNVWRLSKERYAADAFLGDGPRIFGGRWNPVGVPMVYTSLSLSLAVLEVFVHMPKAAEPDDYVAVKATLQVDAQMLERLELEKLPSEVEAGGVPGYAVNRSCVGAVEAVAGVGGAVGSCAG